MVWWLSTKKEVKSSLDRVYDAIKDNSTDIKSQNDKINDLRVQMAKIEALMSSPKVVQETTRKRSKNLSHKSQRALDKIALLAEINELVKRGLRTKEVFEIIVNEKKMCKRSSFFNHLKMVQKQMSKDSNLD